MFADPLLLVLTPGTVVDDTPDDPAVTASLPAISRGSDTSVYQATDSGSPEVTRKVTVGHQFKRRNRVTIRLDSSKVVPDALTPANSSLVSMSGYIVMDSPAVGWTDDEIAQETLYLLQTFGNATALSRVVNGET